VGATERLVLFQTWLLHDLLGVVMLSTLGTNTLYCELCNSNLNDCYFDNYYYYIFLDYYLPANYYLAADCNWVYSGVESIGSTACCF